MIFQNACALYVLINYFTCQQGKKSTNRLFFSQKIWKNHAYDKKRSRDSFPEKRIWWRRCVFVFLGCVSWTMNDILLISINILHSILILAVWRMNLYNNILIQLDVHTSNFVRKILYFKFAHHVRTRYFPKHNSSSSRTSWWWHIYIVELTLWAISHLQTVFHNN